MTVNEAVPHIARRTLQPSDCPHCHGVALDMTGGRCLYCNNTGRIRPSKTDPTTRPIEMSFDEAYALYPSGVMNDSVADWRVYVEPSTVPGRHDIYVQDKIHPADMHHRVCVYSNCKRDGKYDDIRLFLIHLTSRAPLNALRIDQWGPRPF